MGYSMAGFDVVGIDLRPQSKYPFDFIQADALNPPVRLSDFHMIHASPPCQLFSALRPVAERTSKVKREYPNLIPATRALLKASGKPYCIENVEGAPLGEDGFLIMLCGTMFGLGTADGTGELRRHRLFETSFSIPLRPACQHGYAPIGIYGGHVRDRCRTVTVVGETPQDFGRTPRMSVTGDGHGPNMDSRRFRQTFTVQQAREAMGISWLGMKGLSQAIPPAYSEFIARKWMESNA